MKCDQPMCNYPSCSCDRPMTQAALAVSAAAADGKLTKPAQVGNTVFHAGIGERVVIERAMREYVYQQAPRQEAKRLAAFRKFVDSFREAAIEAALLELVALKDMKDRNGGWTNGVGNLDELADYKRRRQLAWEAARVALARYAEVEG